MKKKCVASRDERTRKQSATRFFDRAMRRCFKVFLYGFLIAVPCVSFAQTPSSKDVGNETELSGASDIDGWDQLNITANIPGQIASPTPNPNAIFEFKRGTTGGAISDKTIKGNGWTLSYEDGAGGQGLEAAGGRLFHYDATGVNNTTISNLEFKWGNLSRSGAQGHSIGGGAVFQNFTNGEVRIEDSIFSNNIAAIDNTGTDQDAGAGGAYFNGSLNAPTEPSGQAVNLLGTSFIDNKVTHAASGGAAYGGGVDIADVKKVEIDGRGTASFRGNSITTDGRSGTGGGLYIEGTSVTTDTTEVTISNIDFSGNSVKSNSGGVRGGGLALVSRDTSPPFGDIRIQDTTFLNNSVETGTNATSRGGAISSNHAMTIAAVNKDVRFEGNKASNLNGIGQGQGQSIFSSADVNYEAATGRRIQDTDGIYVQEIVAKTGLGTLALIGTNAVHTMGDLKVMEGTLESSIYSGSGTLQSSFLADDNLSGAGDGTAYFADDTVWRLDISSLNQAEIDDLSNNGVQVATDGFVDGSDIQDTTNAQAALDRGTEMAFFKLTAENEGGEGLVKGMRMTNANMSDIRNSALMMHRWNTIRNATSDRMDLNDYYHRNAGCYGTVNNCCKNSITHSAWANYIGRHNRLESAYYGDDIKMTSHGVQTGIDLISSSRGQLGFMFGYEGQRNRLENDSIDGNDYYFGLYGMRKLANGGDFRAYFGYGFQDYEMDRYSDVMASQLHQSSFDGDVFEVNLELGKRLGCDRAVSFRPVIALDYFNNKIDSANESVSNYYYDDLKLEQLYLRVGSDFQTNSGRIKFNGGLFYSIQMLGDGDSIDSSVTSSGQTLRLAGSDLGNSVLTYTLGTSIALNEAETCQVFGGYNGDIFLDRDGTPLLHSGHVGMLWRF